ncbi:MAG: M1 family metallopeptidase [Telluria sp.]
MTKPQAVRAAAAVALACGAFAAQAEAPFSFAATPGKLPKDVVPVQYAAHLVPNFEADTFLGSETVEIDVLKPADRIMLNVANIGIDAASLSGKDMPNLALTPEVDDKQQTLTFHLPRQIPAGRYQLALKFHGQINREARGLFHMTYKTDAGERKMIASTMEPSDARRMLPTWDEPSFRARFKLTVDVPAKFEAYSNTPVDKREPLENGMQRISFAATPKMPSYLVVLVAGELERASIKDNGVDIGAVTTVGKKGSTGFVLESTREILRYYNNYFGVPYPLPKLDQIAIPGGFNGAMENWGGIVYNEATLLVDPKRSPERMRETSFEVNSHEVAHQWFGNLVTMAWWDNLWLNEGFASWMSTKATDRFHPEWRPYLQAQVGREGVMNLDSRATTHPIQTPIANEEQAAGAFDSITYGKGEAFLRMLEQYVGEDAFRRGIRAYMAKHQYSNTTTADLWAALEDASGKPVAKVASDWTTQPGLPVVKVSQSCTNGKRTVTLSQEPFRLDGSKDERLWNVPVTVGVVNGKTMTTLLSAQTANVMLQGCDQTLVVDPRSVGYFRVQYDQASFDALAMQAPKLPDPTRLKLLTDAWAMVSAGRMQLASYLELAEKYKNEPRMAVWEALLGPLFNLETLAQGEPERPLIRQYIIDLVKPRFAKLGWDEKQGESVEERQLRALFMGALTRAGEPEAVAEAKARFARLLKDPASVPVSQLDVVAMTAGRYADAPTYDALARLVMSTTSNEERNRYGRALTQALDPALAARTLPMALSTQLPPQATTQIVPMVAYAEHVDQAWAFAIAHKDELLKAQDAIGRNRTFPSIVASSSNAAHADMLEAYARDNLSPDAQVEAKRTASAIRVRAAQKARLLPQVHAALAKQ